MENFKKYTKNYQVELKGDLLMVRNSTGDLLKAMVVPALTAADRFNEMVRRVNNLESKK